MAKPKSTGVTSSAERKRIDAANAKRTRQANINQVVSPKQQAANQKKIDTAESIASRNEATKYGSPVPYGDIKQGATYDQVAGINKYAPRQQDYLASLLPLLQKGTANLNLPGNQSSFEPIANEARRKFSQRDLPGLAERFAGLGDTRLSSGSYQQAREGAIGDFESQLAALQAQHGLQEQGLQSNNLHNLLGQYLQPQQDYSVIPGQQSTARNIWEGVKPLAGQAINAAGGPWSALMSLLGRGGQQGYQPAPAIPQATSGTGTGQNSFGFRSPSANTFQPVGNNLSTTSLASAGYPDVNNTFKQGQFKF